MRKKLNEQIEKEVERRCWERDRYRYLEEHVDEIDKRLRLIEEKLSRIMEAFRG